MALSTTAMALLPDGAEEVTEGEAGEAVGLMLRDAVVTKQFWIMCLANLSVIYCLLTIMMHIVPHAMDIGISSIKAAGILSAIGGVSMVGRLVTGIAIDRIGNKKSMIISFFILIVINKYPRRFPAPQRSFARQWALLL